MQYWAFFEVFNDELKFYDEYEYRKNRNVHINESYLSHISGSGEIGENVKRRQTSIQMHLLLNFLVELKQYGVFLEKIKT